MNKELKLLRSYKRLSIGLIINIVIWIIYISYIFIALDVKNPLSEYIYSDPTTIDKHLTGVSIYFDAEIPFDADEKDGYVLKHSDENDGKKIKLDLADRKIILNKGYKTQCIEFFSLAPKSGIEQGDSVTVYGRVVGQNGNMPIVWGDIVINQSHRAFLSYLTYQENKDRIIAVLIIEILSIIVLFFIILKFFALKKQILKLGLNKKYS